MHRLIICLLTSLTLFATHEAIQEVAEKFEREFTLLDVGAGEGEFSFEMADHFEQCCVIMVEDNNPKAMSLSDKLLEQCKDSPTKNTPMLLNKRLFKHNLEGLSTCEYFDMVTFLGGGHYTTRSDTDELDAMLQLGWHTFFETEENSDADNHFATKNPSAVFTTNDGNHLYYFINEKTKLAKDHLLAEVSEQEIKVNYTQNIEIIRTPNPTARKILQRPAGLKLITFKYLYGAFPTTSKLGSFRSNLKLNYKLLNYPHDIIITSDRFSLTAPYLLKEKEVILSKSLLKKIIDASTRKEIKNLVLKAS